MCGIIAFFSRRLPVSEAVLRRATQRLEHRGLDGQRYGISHDRRATPRTSWMTALGLPATRC